MALQHSQPPSIISINLAIFFTLRYHPTLKHLESLNKSLKLKLNDLESHLQQMRSRRKEDSKANARVVEIFASHRNGWQQEERKLLSHIDESGEEIERLRLRVEELESIVVKLKNEVDEREEMINFMSRRDRDRDRDRDTDEYEYEDEEGEEDGVVIKDEVEVGQIGEVYEGECYDDGFEMRRRYKAADSVRGGGKEAVAREEYIVEMERGEYGKMGFEYGGGKPYRYKTVESGSGGVEVPREDGFTFIERRGGEMGYGCRGRRYKVEENKGDNHTVAEKYFMEMEGREYGEIEFEYGGRSEFSGDSLASASKVWAERANEWKDTKYESLETQYHKKQFVARRETPWKVDSESTGIPSKMKLLEQELSNLEKIDKGELSKVPSLMRKQAKRYQSLAGKIDNLCKRMQANDPTEPNISSEIRTQRQTEFLLEAQHLQQRAIKTGQKLSTLQTEATRSHRSLSEEHGHHAKLITRRSLDSIKNNLKEIQRNLEIWLARIMGDLEGILARDGASSRARDCYLPRYPFAR